MVKKILFTPGHSRKTFKWGEVGEVIKRLLDNPEYEVYYLDCAGKAPGYCGLTKQKHPFGYCKLCAPMCKKVVQLAGIKDENIFELKKFKAPKFPSFNTIEDAINYEYEGYNYGLGPVSCIMTMTRDYNFDIKKWNKHLQGFFRTEYMFFKTIEELDAIYNFDEFHTFNGRMPSMYPLVSYAKSKGRKYVVYEQGANINKIRTMVNYVPHEFDILKEEIKIYWEKGAEDREEMAKKWFEDRRKGKFQAMASFTKDQIRDLLPKGFDTSKENFAYFNSSIDEVFAFESWKHPFAKTENDVIKAMLEHYKDDDSKHFYLRIHPNLTRAKKKKATQMREINEFKNLYKNLTIIEPDEKIDTYALMEACDKVLATYSSAACEATYWGKTAILAGKSPYEDCDCVYRANSLEELYSLIDDKNLQPKPRENAYPYGYRNQVQGEDNKYWHSITHDEGDFLGMHLKDKKK